MAKRAGQNEPAYRLLIASEDGTEEHPPTTRVSLETVRTFISFQYELCVRETVEDQQLHYKILGLRTPKLSFPAIGHAFFQNEYPRFAGSMAIVIEGVDGKTNRFRLHCSKHGMEVVSFPDHPFVEVVISD